MKEKILVLSLFFVFVPLLVVSQGYLLLMSSNSGKITYSPLLSPSNEQSPRLFTGSIFSSSDPLNAKVSGAAVSADARPILIKKYLEKYNSELIPYADLIFDVSQKYGLDYRLITAISQQESNLCKKAPENCFNCWGVGIHSRGTMCFESYPEAIDWVGKYLKEEYFDLGINTIDGIMAKYCPLSSGSWSFGIRQFMAEIERNE
jgi:hypothetical protein